MTTAQARFVIGNLWRGDERREHPLGFALPLYVKVSVDNGTETFTLDHWVGMYIYTNDGALVRFSSGSCGIEPICVDQHQFEPLMRVWIGQLLSFMTAYQDIAICSKCLRIWRPEPVKHPAMMGTHIATLEVRPELFKTVNGIILPEIAPRGERRKKSKKAA